MDINDLDLAICLKDLAPEKAKFSANAATMVPLGELEEIVVEWGPFSTPKSVSQYQAFLRHFTWPTNAEATPTVAKSYVEGDEPEKVAFYVEGQPFHGRWRQAFVRERKQEPRPGQIEYYVLLTLRKGFLEAYREDEVRLTSLLDKEGNSVDVDGKTWTASTTSANPGLVSTMLLPNCSRKAAGTILDGFPHTLAAGTTIDGYTVPAGRTLYKTVGDGARRDEDGSCAVTVLYADEQFAFNGFESSNTVDERNIGYLWNVPRQLAETIADEWRGEASTARRGCTASMSGEGGGYLNLVLTARTGAKDNLTTGWVPIACDTYERYHFAWGYTKDELNTFIEDHDSAIGTTENSKVIRSRRITVQQRGDALYDAIIVERSWGGDTTADFTITLPVGTKITRQTDYGYNFSIADINTAKTTYDTTIKAVGLTADFRVTREDDCSFDWVATITTVSKIDSAQQSKQPASTEGVGNIVQAIRHATAAQLGTALAAFTPGIGKALQVSVAANDDETYDATFREITAQTPEHVGTIAISTPGLGVAVASGHSATAAEVTAAIGTFSSGARKRIAVDMRGADDGGWDYFVRQDTVNQTADADIETTGTTGISTKMRYGRNQSAEPAIARDRLKRISGTIQAEDDGTVNHQITEETVAETDKTIQAGSKGENLQARISLNDDPDTLSTDVYPTANGQRVVLEARLDDAGNLHFRKDTIQKAEIEETLKGGTLTETMQIDKSVGDVTRDSADLEKTPTAGVSYVWQARLDSDGSIDWDRITRTAVENVNGTIADGVPTPTTINLARLEPSLDRYGYTDTVVLFRNIALANLPNYDIDTASEYGFLESLRMNDDGTYDGVKRIRVYQASAPGAVWVNNALPDDVTAENPSNTAPNSWVRKTLLWDRDGSGYRRQSETLQELWTDDYGEAVNFLGYTGAGGDHTEGFTERLAYEVVSGRSYWHAVKVTSITVSAWVANTGAAVTPTA